MISSGKGVSWNPKKTLETYMLWHSSKKKTAQRFCRHLAVVSFLHVRPIYGTETNGSKGIQPWSPWDWDPELPCFFFGGGWKFSFPINHDFGTRPSTRGEFTPWYGTELVELNGFGLTHLQLPLIQSLQFPWPNQILENLLKLFFLPHLPFGN